MSSLSRVKWRVDKTTVKRFHSIRVDDNEGVQVMTTMASIGFSEMSNCVVRFLILRDKGAHGLGSTPVEPAAMLQRHSLN